MKRLIKLLLDFGFLGVIKTIKFNLMYFPLREGIYMPVFLTSKVKVHNMGKNRIILHEVGKRKTGLLRIGFLDRDIDKPSSLNIKGTIILRGCGVRSIAPGAIIYVREMAILEINESLSVSFDLKLRCSNKIVIGKDNMWSQYNVVMDSDAHTIYDENGEHINNNKEIIFGDHVWLGCRCIVLKGSKIADGSVIGSGSLVKKQVEIDNAIYGGVGPILLKKNIRWDRKTI